MSKIEELNRNIIKDVNSVLNSKKLMDEAAFNRIISDFIWIARIYNSQYKVEPYDLWYKGYDFLKLDLSDYLGFDSYLFKLEQEGNNLTLMFGQEAILAVRNVIFDRFSNEFMISCAEKFNVTTARFDFLVSKGFIFGREETFQNAGETSFITTIDLLENGQKEKIEEFKYVYYKNDYSHSSIMIDRVNGTRIESTNNAINIFNFDTKYLDDKVDFPISGTAKERIAKITNVTRVGGTEVVSSDENVSFTKKLD